ncbi:MAG: hypothetical protein RJA36_1850 [Pseudomonadota bacterium]|jgi:hypothetical protein
MSRRARARQHHPRRAAVNAVQIAISRACKLSGADVEQQMRIVQTAVADFCCGRLCAKHWRDLADTVNMAEALAELGIGSGAEAHAWINAAQQALADVHERHTQRGTWTLYADEIEALHWLRRLHQVQLSSCSYGEFDRAFKRVHERMAQARAGNAAPGTRVLDPYRTTAPGTQATTVETMA